MVASCPEDKASNVDQSAFWDSNGIHWDQHRIGWAISGACAVLTVLITIYSVLTHARNYHNRNEQRQIIRILYMPPVYAIISFFSYRFFHSYTYYSLIEIVYEAVTLSAFLMLLIEYVSATASGDKAENALLRKDKQPLPFPFCFWRFRPTKPYFMHVVKWSVMQYVIIRPAVSVVGIITEALGVLCTETYSPKFAYVYITAVDFVSISVALYGLILFYSLTHHELEGRRPLAKFLCIKGIVMLTFYQEFVFSALQKYGVIKDTEFWTATNVTDGLSALATTIEMVFFAGFMLWSYRASEYSDPALGKTGIFRPIIDSLNFSDFVAEIWSSLKFFVDYARGKPYTHTPRLATVNNNSRTSIGSRARANFDDAFGLRKGGGPGIHRVPTSESHRPVFQDEGQGGGEYGYGYASAEAISMHSVDEPLNAEELDYRAVHQPPHQPPPRQTPYDPPHV